MTAVKSIHFLCHLLVFKGKSTLLTRQKDLSIYVFTKHHVIKRENTVNCLPTRYKTFQL